jgi:glycosyltransferase involved in cell wall biosynthesis
MSDLERAVCFYCADQNPHRDKSLGISNYTHGLLRNLRASGQVSLHTVTSKSSGGVPDEIPRFGLPFRTDNVIGRLIADQLHPLIVPQTRGQIWHYPKGFLPITFQVRAPKVGTIADTILQFYADHYPTSRSSAAFPYWIGMLKNAVRRFDLILTVSEFSKKSILEFCKRHSINAPPVIVTYQGIDVGTLEPVEVSEKQNYVVHLASTYPHKKTEWLVRRWLKLDPNEQSWPELHLIGQLDPECAALAASSGRIKTQSLMTREQLLGAISRARALLLPSEIEGFGLPALEAYALSTPVAYVKGTAVEEILGSDCCGGFRLEDDSFPSTLKEILKMGATQIRDKSAELGNRFSWKRCVDLTLDAYRRLG